MMEGSGSVPLNNESGKPETYTGTLIKIM